MTVEPPPAPPPAPRWLPGVALRLALLTGVVLVVVSAFQWVLADLLTPYGMTALSMAAWPLMLVALLLAGIAFVLSGGGGRREVRPLLVCFAAIGLAAFVPWTWIDLEARWRLGEGARSQAVALVERGALPRGLSTLPPELRGASAGGGQVVVGGVPGDSLSVLFYTYRGVTGHWSGYLHVSRDEAPAMVGSDSLFQAVRRAPHWFFVASR